MEKANLVWDEYKYRHEHCWKLIFQITAAVVIVSIVPYTNEKIAKSLGYLIVSLPTLGVILTLFSTLRVKKELKLWKTIRDKHMELQQNLGILEYTGSEKSTFRRDVLIYLSILAFLSVINIFAIVFVWIPALNKS